MEELSPVHAEVWLFRRPNGRLFLSYAKPKNKNMVIPWSGIGIRREPQNVLGFHRMEIPSTIFPNVTAENSPHRVMLSITSMESLEAFMCHIGNQ